MQEFLLENETQNGNMKKKTQISYFCNLARITYNAAKSMNSSIELNEIKALP